jgi:hypothetical protein
MRDATIWEQILRAGLGDWHGVLSVGIWRYKLGSGRLVGYSIGVFIVGWASTARRLDASHDSATAVV